MCEDTFVWPAPSPAELAPYYRYESYAALLYDPEAPAERRRTRRFRSLLELAWPPGRAPGRLLDIGCSTGSLLNAARDLGWTVEGLEIDPETARRASQRLGVRVRVGVGLDPVATDERYDLITMSHWLEHSPEPGRHLAKARSLLAPGGAILLRVPNSGGRAARFLREDWLWFDPPLHLQYFTPRSLVVAARSVGLSDDLIRTCQGDAFPLPLEIAGGWARRALGGGGRRVRPGDGARGSPVRGLAPIIGRLQDALPDVNPLARFENTELQAILRLAA